MPRLIIFDEALAVESSSPGAEQWLHELSDGDAATLPAAVRAVASATLYNQSRADPQVAMARVLTRTGAWVVIHGAPLINNGAPRVASIIEQANPDRPAV